MTHWAKRVAVGTGAMVGGVAAASALGATAWKRTTARAVDHLLAGMRNGEPEVFTEVMLRGLPAPVARYFAFALTPGQPLVRRARVQHAGEFRAGLDAPWNLFTSVQDFSVDPPAFVWDARIRVAPLVTVRVRDGYSGGEGRMKGVLASLLPVVNQHGTPELAAGALHRYLAEALWFPTALLPGRGVVWEAGDDRTARATLSDAGNSVSVEFRFGRDGEIVRSYAVRYRDVGGHGVPTPWIAHSRGYADVGGMRIPLEGEVEWILPEGPHSYWRGQIQRIEYDAVDEG